LTAEKMPGHRLHVRAMLRDGQDMFLGSMSLRAVGARQAARSGRDRQGDGARHFRDIFEQDWAKTDTGRKAAEKAKETKDKEKEKEKEQEAAIAAS
jgi:hypothetical protein